MVYSELSAVSTPLPNSPETFCVAFERAGLSEHWPAFEPPLRPEARLNLRPLASDEHPRTGASRIGGYPDLPPDFVWPRLDNGWPLDFLAQFDLVEVAHMAPVDDLPAAGLLSFFYDPFQENWGGESGDRQGWHVAYAAPKTVLAQTERPPSAEVDRKRFTPYPYLGCEVTFETAFSLPDWEEPEVDDRLNDWQPDAPILYLDGGYRSKLGGWPNLVQGSMRFEAEMASTGYSWTNLPADRPAVDQLARERWRLLLQLDSEPAAGFEWGDVGRIYFWVDAEALARCDFEDAWAILQCH